MEIGGAGAQPDIQAQAFQDRQFSGRARGADDPRAQGLGQLQGGDAHARGDPGDQQPLVLGEAALGDQHVVDDHGGDGEGGGLGPGQAFGHGQSVVRVQQRVVGEGGAAAPHDAVAGLERPGIGAGADDFAGRLDAQDGLRAGGLLAQRQEFPAVQAGGAHVDQQLPRPGFGHGDVPGFDPDAVVDESGGVGAHARPLWREGREYGSTGPTGGARRPAAHGWG